MSHRIDLRTLVGTAALAVLFASPPAPATAQEGGIAFETDLPRTLVFITEEGSGENVASLDMSEFLREAGFPIVDPALAHTAAQRELVSAAMEGDEGAAVDLGRDFGAQVIILGTADWGARPDPVDGTLVTATADVNLRALRLDEGNVIASAGSDARAIDATEQRARTKAIRSATRDILQGSSLLGQLMNNWEAQPWREASYWTPDPGSVTMQVQATQNMVQNAVALGPTAQPSSSGSTGSPPGLAILLADVQPSTGGTTRGLGVVKKGDRSSAIFNPVRLEGVVVGEARSVKVEGKEANIEPLTADEATRLGLQGQDARRFWFETTLPLSQDTVSVTAEGPGGVATRAMAAPRIDERWAVVIGIGEYASEDVPDLEFARADAQAVYDFLTSDAAGPFEEDHVLYLTDEEATNAKMREAMFVFLQQADWDDMVFIYYAGHGAPDPSRPDNLYLLPHDARIDALAATAFPMWDVKTALRRQIQAERVIVVADACHSAGTADEDVVGGADANHIAGSFEQLFTPSRRLMMTAADTNEFSLEDARWGGHGVFTHFLLQGLQGEGDANGNGIVTFSELYDFVASNVREATEGRQNPQRSGIGDIPLAAVPATGADGPEPSPEGPDGR